MKEVDLVRQDIFSSLDFLLHKSLVHLTFAAFALWFYSMFSSSHAIFIKLLKHISLNTPDGAVVYLAPEQKLGKVPTLYSFYSPPFWTYCIILLLPINVLLQLFIVFFSEIPNPTFELYLMHGRTVGTKNISAEWWIFVYTFGISEEGTFILA